MIGLPEVAIIGGIVVLMFGAKKIPDLARSVGKGIREFKDGMNEAVEEPIEEEPEKKPEDKSE